MQDDLQSLLELSEVDKKVHELKLLKKDLPGRIQALRDEIERESAALEKINRSLADTRQKIADNQDQGVTEQTALTESNRRLDNITTNREYDAVHSEIAIHKRNIDTAQANVLHYQQMLENLEKEKEEVEAHHRQVVETNGPELEKLTAELNGIEDRISAEASKGDVHRVKINKRILSVYDRVVKRRNNPNVIALVNRDQRFCSVCNRTQTPQKVIEISKRNALNTCESCGSILIWKDF